MNSVSKDLIISGLVREGYQLVALSTLAQVANPARIRYQWQADGQDLANATGKTLTLSDVHVGKSISVSATYTDLLGQVRSVVSPASEWVAPTAAGSGVHLAVRLSQAAADSMLPDDGSDAGIGGIVDSMVQLQASLESRYSQSQRYTVGPTEVTGYFSDGATRTRTYVKDVPGASSGLATVSEWVFNKPGATTLAYGGSLRYSYNEATGSLALLNGTVNDYTLNSQAAHPIYGRQSVVMLGALSTTGGLDAKLQGKVQSVHVASSQLVRSASFEGEFAVSGDISDMSDGLGQSRVDGILTGLAQSFHDGSYLRISGNRDAVPLPIVDGQLLDPDQWQGQLDGDDQIELSLPERPGGDWSGFQAGPGNDRLTLEGGGGQIAADAGPGDDWVSSLAGSQQMAGGEGVDTLVLPRDRSHYLLRWSEQGRRLELHSHLDGTDLATDFERFEFKDGVFTRAELMQSQVTRVQIKAWNQAPVPDFNLGNARTDAQGWAAWAMPSAHALPAAVPADDRAKAHVNLNDAIVVLKSIVGLVNLSAPQRLAADFDGTREVNLSDAIGILKHVVGLAGVSPVWRLHGQSADGQLSSISALQLGGDTDQSVQLVGVLAGDVDGSWAAG